MSKSATRVELLCYNLVYIDWTCQYDLGLWTPKTIGVSSIYVWRTEFEDSKLFWVIVYNKVWQNMSVCPWPFDPKIYRCLPFIVFNLCMTSLDWKLFELMHYNKVWIDIRIDFQWQTDKVITIGILHLRWQSPNNGQTFEQTKRLKDRLMIQFLDDTGCFIEYECPYCHHEL